MRPDPPCSSRAAASDCCVRRHAARLLDAMLLAVRGRADAAAVWPVLELALARARTADSPDFASRLLNALPAAFVANAPATIAALEAHGATAEVRGRTRDGWPSPRLPCAHRCLSGPVRLSIDTLRAGRNFWSCRLLASSWSLRLGRHDHRCCRRCTHVPAERNVTRTLTNQHRSDASGIPAAGAGL